MLRGDDEAGDDDEDDAERLEARREVAVVAPRAVQRVRHGQRDGGRAEEALHAARDRRALLRLLLFLRDDLRGAGFSVRACCGVCVEG